eukprot:CAMPEP_0172203086 /NCGR_PEP_ID=MMETSP1050-20130122/31060_1 /TAXON_ID=233186 /ORGANISM="Cryptomonas curvata, Strain CCAP979/52" /LENGTH=32 /DNA_ID= /DNA_START= /DNA_END= /DNA_ORIENTATION=
MTFDFHKSYRVLPLAKRAQKRKDDVEMDDITG